VWKAFNELGSRCHEAGPLDEKTRRLVKLALSIGARLEGAGHSVVRNAYNVGITQEEIDHLNRCEHKSLLLIARERIFRRLQVATKGLQEIDCCSHAP
jgi:hypothetical protein